MPEDEFYEVYANWHSDAGYGSDVPYIIAHADGTDTYLADQTGNGGTWMPMGSYRFEDGTARQSITVTLRFLSQGPGRRRRDQQNRLPAARPPG